MAGCYTDDRTFGGQGWTESLDLSGAHWPSDTYSRLPLALQLHCLTLHQKGRHVLSICADIRRRGAPLAPEQLEAELQAALAAARAWLKRPLPPRFAFVFYERLPVRHRGKEAGPVWTAMGIGEDGQRSILGLWPERAEAGFWLEMQRDLRRRGLRHVVIAVPDRGGAILPAIAACFPRTLIALSPLQALAPTLRALPSKASTALGRALESTALAKVPPRAQTLLHMAGRLTASQRLEEQDAHSLQGMRSFLALSPALRAFILRSRVMTAIREKLQRNTACFPMEANSESRALLLACLLRGLDNGWKVGLGRWRAIHDGLAALRQRRPQLGDQRLDAQTVGHADQFHERRCIHLAHDLHAVRLDG